MQPSKIKIAGFKSFVDPTTILLPSRRIAIVGPNGCGKSNIIDAVSWVMGESSPKYLRGESLTDVIFNGSSARKPVGQASVELIFDNSDGSLGGEYAQYAEISVKRVINRDSDSQYYLNNTRCRKRDIRDLFHGTGLGPRSYSIIGQNMIGRIIEAKPDELRSYLEEAAGISKYKERRHETELRINHTKENLARVHDVTAELEKQLSHLKHQANVAEKYKSLKQQERVLRAELLGLQWRQLDSYLVDHTLKIQYEETALEARQSEIITVTRDIEQLRHEQRAAHDVFQEVQRRYYAVGNEITRIEQDILHHQEREKQWRGDLQQIESDWQLVRDQLDESESDLQQFEHQKQVLEPQFKTAKHQLDITETSLAENEEKMQQWQDQWDDFNKSSLDISSRAQTKKNQIEQIEQRIAWFEQRQAQLSRDNDQFDSHKLEIEINESSEVYEELLETKVTQQQVYEDGKTKISQLREELKQAQVQLDRLRSELQQLLGQQASLESLQAVALGQRDNPALPWLKEHHLEKAPRLLQHIDVEKGWETAVEKVLGFCLQAVCVNDFTTMMDKINDAKGNVCLFKETAASLPDSVVAKGTPLSAKIHSSLHLESLLYGIYTADNLAAALEKCELLAANESIVTPEGIWVNASWIKILNQEDPAAGVFQREESLKKLAERIKALQNQQNSLIESIEERQENLQTVEVESQQLQHELTQLQAKLAQLGAEQKLKTDRVQEMRNQQTRVIHEQEELVKTFDAAKKELTVVKAAWQEALQLLEAFSQQRDDLLFERDQLRQTLQSAREATNQQKSSVHQLDVQLQTIHTQTHALKNQLSRLQTQLQTLNERKIGLQSELASMPPMDSLNKSLSRALDKHVSIESELNSARIASEALEQELKNLEEKKYIFDKDVNRVRSILENLRVEWHGWKVKLETVMEQLKETEFSLEEILKQLSEEANPADWQQKLDQVTQRITRLGAINLMAIEEFATCSERKDYLDKQMADLQEGLNTLEAAIEKIDRETRTRFKETFDQVNQRFQELFPTIFGGGKAYLELNNSDLLVAGVTMMACPPGKRNSSIYLLSGGEKSLTAIAFIFSIFHLNPAPFCMLDEVDAALDDANVVRFTRLVKTMTDQTQFIIISHNKITIEMADHLIGVTMNEPGVSRLVSVDIEKAISLATA